MSYIRKIICCIIILQGLSLRAQYVNWQYVDTILSGSVNAIYYDSTDNSTYLGGFYYRIDTDTIWGIGKYQNGQWYRMGNGINWDRSIPFCSSCWPNPVKDIIKYHDTLYITGEISFSGNTALNGISWWDGNNWQPVIGNTGSNGMYGYGEKFEIYNDELYIMGSFDTIAGVVAHSIAKYDGTSWQPVHDLPIISQFSNSNHIYDMELYNGELYLGGTFVNSSTNIYNLIKWDGSNWVFPGFGAYGIADVSKLFIFQGELYVTGQWSEYYNANNIGHCIAKYNGSSWTAVGEGAFFYPNNLGAIRSYAIKNNDLYLGGSFDFCNSITAYNFIKYDGNFWCSIDTTFQASGCPVVMKFINDTLFVGGPLAANMGFCYCIDENYTDNCSADQTGFESQGNNNPLVNIYPNPVENKLIVNSMGSFELGELEYKIINVQGQLMKFGNITDENFIIHISDIASGVYFIQIQYKEQLQNFKIIKK